MLSAVLSCSFDGMLEADEEEMKETVVFGLFTMIAVNPVAIEKVGWH